LHVILSRRIPPVKTRKEPQPHLYAHPPGMGPLISSASTPEQAEANAQTGKVELTAEQRGKVGGVVGG
jgi:hypothetical protein